MDSETWGIIKRRIRSFLSRPEVRGAIQSAVGLLILLSIVSAPAIWNDLSLEEVNIGPIYIFVSFVVVLQPNVGSSLSYVAQRLVGAVVGSVLALICMYITFAANGSSYAPSVTKGSVMTASVCLMEFFVCLLTFRFQQYWFCFIVMGISIPIVSLSGYHLDYLEVKAMAFFIAEMVIGVISAALVSIFVFPISAGRSITTSTCRTARLLGRATEELMHILLEAPESLSQSREIIFHSPSTLDMLSASSQRTSHGHPIDQSTLQAFVEQWANPISDALFKAKSLLVPVSTEINVYASPRIFPRGAYGIILSLLRHYLSTMMTLVYLGQEKAPLSAMRVVRYDVFRVSKEMLRSLDAAADVLENRSEEAFLKSLENELSSLEQAFGEFVTFRIPDRNPQGGERFSDAEIVMVDTFLAIFFALGSRIRRLYFSLPEAIASNPNGLAWRACRKHFDNSSWDFEDGTIPSSPKGLQNHLERLSSSLTVERMSHVSSSFSIEDERPRLSIEDGASDGELRLGIEDVLRKWMHQILHIRLPWGLKGDYVTLSFQRVVALIITVSLHVCTASYRALGESTIWGVISVIVLSQKSVGGMALRGANRLVGTVMGGANGLGVLYFVYLTNGLSYDNNPSKFVVMTIVLSLMEGFLMYKSMLSKFQWVYAWTVWKLTLPIIALSGYIGTTIHPDVAGWRLLNISIGMTVELLTSTLVFPVSSRDVIIQRICSILEDFASMSEVTASKLLQQHSDEGRLSAAGNRRGSTDGSFNAFDGAAWRQELAQFASRSENLNDVADDAGSVSQDPNEEGERSQRSDFTMHTQVADVPRLKTTVKASHETPEQTNQSAFSAHALAENFIGRSSSRLDIVGRAKEMSIRKKWLKNVAFGKSVMLVRMIGRDAAKMMQELKEFELVLHFERDMTVKYCSCLLDCGSLPRFEDSWLRWSEEVAIARKALRRMLNVLMTFAYVLDGPDVLHVSLLAYHRSSIDDVMVHMAGCFELIGEVAAGKSYIEDLEHALACLSKETEKLLAKIESMPPPSGCTHADIVLGFAAMGVLVAMIQALGDLARIVIIMAVRSSLREILRKEEYDDSR